MIDFSFIYAILKNREVNMSISIRCYPQVPLVQDRSALEAELIMPDNNGKVDVLDFKVPSISPKTLELFRELGCPAPSGINTCSANISKYCKHRADEISDPSLIVKIVTVAVISLISLSLAFVLEISPHFMVAVAAYASYDVATSWSTAVHEKTKAKYAARADFIESFKFSIASDELKVSLDKKLKTNDQEIQLAEKARMNAKSLWQKCVTYMKQPKIHTPDELKTAISELEKVRAFYNQFDPVIKNAYDSDPQGYISDAADLFQKVGFPVSKEIMHFNEDQIKKTLADKKDELSRAEKDSLKHKFLGISILALSVSLVAFGVITTPLGHFGAFAFGGLCALIAFTKARLAKHSLECYQDLVDDEKQEISKFISKNYAALKEKLLERGKAGLQTSREARILRLTIIHLEALNKLSKSDFAVA